MRKRPVSPWKFRALALALGTALGGAFLSIGFVHSFSQNMTIGKGFIGLAAVIFLEKLWRGGPWLSWAVGLAFLVAGRSSFWLISPRPPPAKPSLNR